MIKKKKTFKKIQKEKIRNILGIFNKPIFTHDNNYVIQLKTYPLNNFPYQKNYRQMFINRL